jgi:uroporphyrin-III C-methyltransferase
MVGKVYIVGAGPGDPELLTLKALRAIEEADVVLYDRLVGDGIIEMLKKMNKRLIYVGKNSNERGGDRQKEINEMLKKLAEEGKTVVRLKGGDPFVFGRGGVEVEFLARHGIPFEVIPGVSSINSVPAYAGIPLTHPTLSSSILVVTGKDDVESWCNTILNGTIVVLMGRHSIKEICDNLIRAGRKPETPVAVIENGTLKNQRVFFGTLKDIADIVERENVNGPTLIVIGEVVKIAVSSKTSSSL